VSAFVLNYIKGVCYYELNYSIFVFFLVKNKKLNKRNEINIMPLERREQRWIQTFAINLSFMIFSVLFFRTHHKSASFAALWDSSLCILRFEGRVFKFTSVYLSRTVLAKGTFLLPIVTHIILLHLPSVYFSACFSNSAGFKTAKGRDVEIKLIHKL
jgi:hypothetical protein